MKQLLFAAVSLLIIPLSIAPAMAQGGMAKLCGMCHDPEPGVMMGFLENIAIKSGTILMDIDSRKEIITFNKDTKVKHVRNFQDIRNYKKKGFQINYVEKGGSKLATDIIRFDLVNAIEDDKKLNRSEFKKFRRNPKVRVYDVRPVSKYETGHIPGAENIPATDFDMSVAKLPAEKTIPIVFYGVGGCLSPTALVKTEALGYTNAKIYSGGFPDWSKNGYGTVSVDWLKSAIENEIPHVLIDLRPGNEVIKGHIKGAVGIQFSDLEANRRRLPARKKAPIIFYGQNSKKAALQVAAWGYEAVRVLPVSFSEWKESNAPVTVGVASDAIAYVPKPKPGTIDVIEFENVADSDSDTVTLIDVRNPDEFEKGNITGTLNIPVEAIVDRLEEINSKKEIILFCNTGIRAEMAHTLLKAEGVESKYFDGRVIFEDGDFEVEEN